MNLTEQNIRGYINVVTETLTDFNTAIRMYKASHPTISKLEILDILDSTLQGLQLNESYVTVTDAATSKMTNIIERHEIVKRFFDLRNLSELFNPNKILLDSVLVMGILADEMNEEQTAFYHAWLEIQDQFHTHVQMAFYEVFPPHPTSEEVIKYAEDFNLVTELTFEQVLEVRANIEILESNKSVLVPEKNREYHSTLIDQYIIAAKGLLEQLED